MPHLTPAEIFDLDRLPSECRNAALAHLSTCHVCQHARETHCELWNQLGHWHTPDAPDLSSTILQRMQSRWSRTDLLRVAAAIALAATVGYASGQIAASRHAPQHMDSEQAIAALHLDALDDAEGGPLAVILEPLERSSP